MGDKGVVETVRTDIVDKPVNSYNAVFVTFRTAMSDRPGGVQTYTREILSTLAHAAICTHTVCLDPDRSLKARLARKLRAAPYQNMVAKESVRAIAVEYLNKHADFVLLNGAHFLEIAQDLRQVLPDATVVLLSHGLESTDYLHTIRSHGYGEAFASSRRSQHLHLARQLIIECRCLKYIDGAISLSENESEIKRWLGVQHSYWIPRAIKSDPVAWAPLANRVGFVGTLDHPPNVEGLHLVLRALERKRYNVNFRVVGGPSVYGLALAKQYPMVDYLGPLSDSELRTEAASWQAFLHPVFCYARGASTKLAVGLSWGIPVVATTAGCRGYSWPSGHLPQEENAIDFAGAVWRICTDSRFRDDVRSGCEEIVKNAPSTESNAPLLRRHLDAALNGKRKRVLRDY